jgi:hypothetical protein
MKIEINALSREFPTSNETPSSYPQKPMSRRREARRGALITPTTKFFSFF